jgi:hypothetical protein
MGTEDSPQQYLAYAAFFIFGLTKWVSLSIPSPRLGWKGGKNVF